MGGPRTRRCCPHGSRHRRGPSRNVRVWLGRERSVPSAPRCRTQRGPQPRCSAPAGSPPTAKEPTPDPLGWSGLGLHPGWGARGRPDHPGHRVSLSRARLRERVPVREGGGGTALEHPPHRRDNPGWPDQRRGCDRPRARRRGRPGHRGGGPRGCPAARREWPRVRRGALLRWPKPGRGGPIPLGRCQTTRASSANASVRRRGGRTSVARS
jgi:hypothetical protein